MKETESLSTTVAASENTIRACKRIIIALGFGFITLRPDVNAGLALISAGASIYNMSVAYRYRPWG